MSIRTDILLYLCCTAAACFDWRKQGKGSCSRGRAAADRATGLAIDDVAVCSGHTYCGNKTNHAPSRVTMAADDVLHYVIQYQTCYLASAGAYLVLVITITNITSIVIVIIVVFYFYHVHQYRICSYDIGDNSVCNNQCSLQLHLSIVIQCTNAAKGKRGSLAEATNTGSKGAV